MRILAINRYFGNDEVPTGRMLRDLSDFLLWQGDKITVLTTYSHYRGGEENRVTPPGITMRRLWTTGEKNRLLSWFLFWLQACFLAPFLKWDRCIILTDPPFLTIIPALNRLLGKTGRKIYWWTMDLYPEAPVADGLIKKGGLLHQFLRYCNDLGMRYLAGIICLGEAQRRRLSSYRHWRKEAGFSLVVPPWDYRPITPVPPSRNRFLEENALSGYRIVLYAGNLGKAHSYAKLLQAARAMAGTYPEWKFLFVARGSLRAKLERESADLLNVIVLDYQPPELTADLLRAAAVHVITMKPGWEGIVVPSKLYGILKTTTPVLFIGPEDSDTALEIKKYQAGAVLPSDSSVQEVVEELLHLYEKNISTPAPAGTRGAREIGEFITG
jgi:glycosyltransferase involved in cell wall biosynthesis